MVYYLTHIGANVLFLYSLKISENRNVFWCFQEGITAKAYSDLEVKNNA